MVLDVFRRDKMYLPSQKIGDYTINGIVGEGRYGICYDVTDDQGHYILKQLKRGMLKRVGIKAHYEEKILCHLNHNSIPRFIKKLELKGFNGYVLEYKNGRTFEDIIYLDKYIFSKNEVYKVGAQIIEIIKYLHSHGVVHRDIRVSNTLYHDGKVYLVDFGLARWVNKKYKKDMDFAFLGDFLLHLYYSSFSGPIAKKRPWYEELELTNQEMLFIKRLMGVEERYKSIGEVEKDFKIVLEDVLEEKILIE